MPYLEIDPSELELPEGYVIPPCGGSSPSDWATYRARKPARRALALTAPIPRRSPEWPLVASVAPSIRGRFVEFYTPPPMTRQSILSEVALDHGVMVETMSSQTHKNQYVRPRHEAMFRLRVEKNMTMPEIGRILGGRDHTTVLSGIRAHCEREEIPLPKGMRSWTEDRIAKRRPKLMRARVEAAKRDSVGGGRD
jgi:hypothetical protein